MENYKNISEPILNTLRLVLKRIQKFHSFDTTFDNVEISCRVGKQRVVHATELVNLGLLANVGRIITQLTKVGRTATIAASAVTGVVSALLLILDVLTIVKDSIDIHQMRQGETNDPKKVTFGALKSIAQGREIHTELCNVLKEIKQSRVLLNRFDLDMNNINVNVHKIPDLSVLKWDK